MIRVRTCIVCGKEFAVDNGSRKCICSYECRRKHANELRREARASERLELPQEKPVEKPKLSSSEIARLAKPYGMSYGQYVAWKGL